MSVFMTPSKCLELHSPPPLPVITLHSFTLPQHDPPSLGKPTKHKREDKKKKKSKPKRSKSCPPIEDTKEGAKEGAKSPKKVRLPVVDNKKKSSAKEPAMVVVSKSKAGKSAPPSRSMPPGSSDPPPQVRLITLTKLKEEDIREKLRQSVFKISARSKPIESGGIIVVDDDRTNRNKTNHKPFQTYPPPSTTQGMLNDLEEPTTILKHRRFGFNKQLSDEPKDKPTNKKSSESSELKSKSSSKLKKQLSLELPNEKEKEKASDVKQSKSQKSSAAGNNNRTKTDVSTQATSSSSAQNMSSQSKTQLSSGTQKSAASSKVPPSRQQVAPSLTSPTVDSNAPSPSKSKKAPKGPSLLVKVKPMNQESEREKFFNSNFTYNPQFMYRNVPSQNEMDRFSHASASLLHIAIKIMRVAIKKYGTYEKFEEKTGGPKLSRSQIAEAAHAYLKNENLEDEVTVMLSDDLVSRACMSRVNGKPTLLIRTGCMRQHWVHGMLRHEIGTHYLRSCNNRHQVWSSSRKRRELDLLPLNPTEEGLASLHSVIFRDDPNLWRCSLLYYVIYQASRMSFSELFKDIGQFVKDPAVRWDYCLRAKRGMEDTSQPGAFCKDQVYLKGVLQILRHRRHIDFHMLIKAGKVDFRDLDRLRYVVDPEKTRIPSFMKDIYVYRIKLEEIFKRNKLADAELESIEELEK